MTTRSALREKESIVNSLITMVFSSRVPFYIDVQVHFSLTFSKGLLIFICAPKITKSEVSIIFDIYYQRILRLFWS